MPLTTAQELIALGIHSEPALKIAGSANAAVTAAGTTIADATRLRNRYNYVSTAAASSGVKLPQVAIGDSVIVQNGGASDLKVYPPDAVQFFNAASAGGSLTLAALTDVILVAIKVSATRWIAYVVAGPAA